MEGATRRDFNIGIQAGKQLWTFELGLSPATVAAIAALDGRVVVTVYGAEVDGS